MLNRQATVFFIRQLEYLFNSEIEHRKKYLRLFAIVKEISDKALEAELQFFSNFYAKFEYIANRLSFTRNLRENMRRVRIFSAKLNRNAKLYCSNEDINHAFRVAILFLKAVSTEFDNIESKLLKRLPQIQFQKPHIQEELIDNTSAIITKHYPEKKAIICENEEFGAFYITLKARWFDILEYSKVGDYISIFKIKRTSEKPLGYRVTHETIITLEPDFLVDVTEVSECFDFKGFNTNHYLLKKFFSSGISYAMIIGNLVNSIFDSLIENPSADFEESIELALKSRPLSIIALAKKEPEKIDSIRKNIAMHWEQLRNIIQNINGDIFSIEPSFISPDYGLQGRLDLLAEYEDIDNQKDVIELKSGNPPKEDLIYFLNENQPVRIGLWNNHFIQATCYNLLLDSSFPHRSGTSSLLYSKSLSYPLRNAPNVVIKKQEAIDCRNRIVSIEKQFFNGDFSVLKNINIEDFGSAPPFLFENIENFEKSYIFDSVLLRDYFHYFIQFVTVEMFSQKIGSSVDQYGFNSLWRETSEEKIVNLLAISGLIIDYEKSNFKQNHIYFNRKNKEVSSFRKGDICIIHPENHSIFGNLLKGSIKEISDNHIKISLRNKMTSSSRLKNYPIWICEPDYIDSTIKKLFSNLFDFLSSNKRKRDLILGLEIPECVEKEEYTTGNLNKSQADAMQKAISSKDYFLVVGPPGTGKTSYFLRQTLENILNTTDETILMLAFTNRAVDQICSSLKKIEGLEFLRLGNRDSSEHSDVLLSELAQSMTINEIKDKIKSSRVICSTVTSAHVTPEIFEIKQFDTIIIDEASQIIEPQLVGLLTKADRFIMIGDEKQLPAVIVQKQGLAIPDESLEKIHITKEHKSIFERLLINAKQKEWHHCYGALNQQARMHKEIQELANYLTYDGLLEVLDENSWQTEEETIFSKHEYTNILKNKRVMFICSKPELKSKVNLSEIEIILEIIQNIEKTWPEDITEKTIGIISPFRAQCSEIINHLPENLKSRISVDTVERFQGSERDIIIISFALNYSIMLDNILSQPENKEYDRKLNVAMTRAKKYLYLIGNDEILRINPVYNKLFEYLKNEDRIGQYDDIIKKIT